MNLDQVFENAHFGVNVARREEVKFGIRLVPFVEIFSTDQNYLNEIHIELLRFSVSSTVRPKFLRMQGVQNCLILSRYCKDLWWLKCMEMFEQKEHLTKDGIFKIMYMREKRGNVPTQMKNRVTMDEAVKIVMEA